MNWFVISIIPPMVWAFANHIDKYLLSRFFKNQSGIVFMIATALVSATLLPVIFLLSSNQLDIGMGSIIVLTATGFVGMIAGIFYLLAMKESQPSVVVPLFQLMPVFNYILGLVFLGEHLSGLQIAGSLLIIFGALALVMEQNGSRFTLKFKILLYMILACIISAFFDLFFKKVALGNNFWGANFWLFCGQVIFGIIALLVTTWRKEFVSTFKSINIRNGSLLLFDQYTSMAAGFIFKYALLIMPIALVSVVANGLQPFFVLLFGIILTLLIPSLAHETLTRRNLGQKIAAILIMFLGTYFLNK